MANDPHPPSWFAIVQSAFPQDLSQRIHAEAAQRPQLCALFEDLANYTLTLTSASQTLPTNTKKRKLDDSSTPHTNGSTSSVIKNPQPSFECKDVSVQIPARKKLKLSLVKDARDERRAEVRLLNPTSDDLEYALAADQIEAVFAMPVPDKQARQRYVVVLPKADAVVQSGIAAEAMLFTLPETVPPAGVMADEEPIAEDETYVSVSERALARLLAPHGKRITRPDAAEFASARVQPHRKGEKAHHVNAYRGSKEGYLYFLPNGILFGFKKPLSFYSFGNIESISYTSVLQRTFNLVISASDFANTQTPNEIKETEFSMLDQEDFAAIDAYVKRHGLNDASMAADRRAKAYNINKEKKADGEDGEVVDAGGVDENGMTELQRAEQQLQDQEDEEEEDYEASGGESDGEGDESGEDEDGEEGYDEEVAEEEEEEEEEAGVE